VGPKKRYKRALAKERIIEGLCCANGVRIDIRDLARRGPRLSCHPEPRSKLPAPYVRAHYSDTRPIQLSVLFADGIGTYPPYLTCGPQSPCVGPHITWRKVYRPGLESVRRVRRLPRRRLLVGGFRGSPIQNPRQT
jgi:hypothetical protein